MPPKDGILKYPFEGTEAMGGKLVHPTLLVIHYTASGGKDGHADAEYFRRPGAKSSAHFVVGRDGSIEQVVPVTRQAWHAGVSIWRGKTGCNQFSIGIEVDNWGYLYDNAAGGLTSHAGVTVAPEDARFLTHKNEKTPRYWETYPSAQFLAVVELSKEIITACPTITEVAGHEDIAPGRKSDPGPAWDMERFRSLIFGRSDDNVITQAEVNVSWLNLRSGPGVEYPIIDQLKFGEHVQVVYDVPGSWTQIKTGVAEGYVNDRFLSPV